MGCVDDYELIDAGDGARLERFGRHVVDRPHAGILAPRRTPDRWPQADLRFDRERGWSGTGLDTARTGWTCRTSGLTMNLRPTDAGQVGLFPEHAERLAWLTGEVAARRVAGDPVSILNVFAYTGLATLALARAGAAVTHVDASRPAVTWARENATANGLADRPVRWIVDDARSYARREVRRDRRYDGILLDPPSYGHGGRGAAWQLETDLPDLLATCTELLADDGFLLLTTHTEGYGPARLGSILRAAVGTRPGLRHGMGDVGLKATSGAELDLGAYALLTGRA